ncbi:hypothetical protein [Pseudacidovorax sp. NFM-22]|uniref:hypothetical protein n=1 Tax=Pseudacidovorax sp. NFM-22 TaxID=2744469 RepID=UPI001F2BB39E|nr:hypothetical protein [Pseudacidovorax sp. NFM-22]
MLTMYVVLPPVADAAAGVAGAMQSVGTTLSEEIVYFADVQPLTWSLHDYGLPFASDLGDFDVTHTETRRFRSMAPKAWVKAAPSRFLQRSPTQCMTPSVATAARANCR